MWCPKFVGPTFGGREVWTFLYASLVAESDDGGRQTRLFSGLWPLRTSYSTKPLLWNSLTTTLPCRRPYATELGEKHGTDGGCSMIYQVLDGAVVTSRATHTHEGLGLGAIVAERLDMILVV